MRKGRECVMDGMELISPRPEHVHISAVLEMGQCTCLAASHKFLLSCVGIRQLLPPRMMTMLS